MPNHGRPSEVLSPTCMSYLHPDPDRHLDVELLVRTDTYHWMIVWVVDPKETEGHIKARIIHLVQEPGCNYLTYWGAKTQSLLGATYRNAKRLKLGSLSLTKRRELEQLAKFTRVQVADGDYDCQKWIERVLEQVQGRNLLSGQTCSWALDQARRCDSFWSLVDDSLSQPAASRST
ncbi:hypothetical protein CPC08DRAFT_749509 [Agrocybe pediades]|nr:hypothetical protein CPC08DRAFT_749509 [Agrocybe pediades]